MAKKKEETSSEGGAEEQLNILPKAASAQSPTEGKEGTGEGGDDKGEGETPKEPTPDPKPDPDPEPKPEKVSDYVAKVLIGYPAYAELYIDAHSGVYSPETPAIIRKTAVLYKNPHYKK